MNFELRMKQLAASISAMQLKSPSRSVWIGALLRRNAIQVSLTKLFDRFERQRRLREPGVWLPTALARKYPSAAIQWGW